MVLSKKMVDEDVLALGRQRVAHIFDKFDHVAVSFSGGKDSTVCLQLALEEAQKRGRLPLDVVFWDEEALPPECIEYMHRVAVMPGVALRWLCLPVKHRNACSRRSPFWNPWAPEDRDKWCYPLPPQAITELPGFARQTIPESNHLLYDESLGSVGCIVGLRAQESIRRYRAVAHRTHDNYISQDQLAKHVFLCKPIYDWQTADVWTAPRQLGWDYNRCYDTMAKAGIPRHAQRCCPPFGEEPLRGLWMYSQCWPDLWAKMSVRVPGSATAARYCRSPIYGFGEVLDVCLPEGVSWQEAIGQALKRWRPEEAKDIAERLQAYIRHHAKMTTDPLTERPHPKSGVGWGALLNTAVRGDLKLRRTHMFMADAADQSTDSIFDDGAGDEVGRL
jgi:predicted phosphoadenosine phosphosulfate sulfurtransferase